jgi:hypothetical protein
MLDIWTEPVALTARKLSSNNELFVDWAIAPSPIKRVTNALIINFADIIGKQKRRESARGESKMARTIDVERPTDKHSRNKKARILARLRGA